MISNEIPGLTQNEQALYNVLTPGIPQYFSDLKKQSGLSESGFYRAWYGVNGSFNRITGGLLQKVKGLRIEEHYDKDSGYRDKIVRIDEKLFTSGTAPYTLSNTEAESIAEIAEPKPDPVPVPEPIVEPVPELETKEPINQRI